MAAARTGFGARLQEAEPMLGALLKIPSTQPAEILGTRVSTSR